MFLLGTPQQVQTRVRSLLAAMQPFPTFVLSSGCDIPPNTPLENLDAFFHALATHNQAQRQQTPAQEAEREAIQQIDLSDTTVLG